MAWALIGSKSPFGFQLTDNSTGLAGDQRESECDTVARYCIIHKHPRVCTLRMVIVLHTHIWCHDTTTRTHVNTNACLLHQHICTAMISPSTHPHFHRGVVPRQTGVCVCVHLSHIHTSNILLGKKAKDAIKQHSSTFQVCEDYLRAFQNPKMPAFCTRHCTQV